MAPVVAWRFARLYTSWCPCLSTCAQCHDSALLAPIMSVGLVYIIWVNGDTQTAGFAISLSVVVALVLMTAASVLLM